MDPMRTVHRIAFCRSQREISNAYLHAKFGFDTAKNEPCKVCTLSAYRSPRSSHILEQLDTKQDGVLSRSEFLRYALIKFEHVKTSDLDSIDRLFDSLDRKKSGKLTKRQIVAGCD